MKAILFDVDGVLVEASYAKFETFGIISQMVEPFFTGPFKDALIGKIDTKEALKPYLEQWKFTGSVDDFLLHWHEYENNPRKEMLKLVKKLRAEGYIVCVATNQDLYRTAYLKNNMGFSALFDQFYSSCDLGVQKYDNLYFTKVIDDLNVLPEEILFFDDTEACIKSAESIGIHAHLCRNYVECKAGLALHL